MMRIVYSPRYNISFGGIERLHPFDSRKYGRAWKQLRAEFGVGLDELHMAPDREIRRDELLRMHTPEYLESLRSSAVVATALELPVVGFLPSAIVDRAVLRPMRWATRGTLLAAEAATEHGCAVNLSGGYHHAKPSGGEGFCLYADIALAVDHLRQSGRLAVDDLVAYVDLDAHQGNGVSHCFLDDRRLKMFDMFNAYTYPQYDAVARERIDFQIPLRPGCADDTYLSLLETGLPTFLDDAQAAGRVGLGIYVAGTDVLAGDPIGQLGVTAPGILRRDLIVVRSLREREIPVLILLGGGYTRSSFRLVADMVAALIRG